MKKPIVALLTVATLATLTGRHQTAPEAPQPTPDPATITKRVIAGRYTTGELITADGHIWNYDGIVRGENIPEHHQTNTPVYAVMHDNGTPDEITDDIIMGLVFDRETAIYDDIETNLSESFTVTREGNNLHVSPRK